MERHKSWKRCRRLLNSSDELGHTGTARGRMRRLGVVERTRGHPAGPTKLSLLGCVCRHRCVGSRPAQADRAGPREHRAGRAGGLGGCGQGAAGRLPPSESFIAGVPLWGPNAAQAHAAERCISAFPTRKPNAACPALTLHVFVLACGLPSLCPCPTLALHCGHRFCVF
jgi:hypothetical protein